MARTSSFPCLVSFFPLSLLGLLSFSPSTTSQVNNLFPFSLFSCPASSLSLLHFPSSIHFHFFDFSFTSFYFWFSSNFPFFYSSFIILYYVLFYVLSLNLELLSFPLLVPLQMSITNLLCPVFNPVHTYLLLPLLPQIHLVLLLKSVRLSLIAVPFLFLFLYVLTLTLCSLSVSCMPLLIAWPLMSAHRPVLKRRRNWTGN